MTGGLLFCLIGTAFLTIAGWLALLPLVGVQLTAVIFAGLYLGVGLILIGVSTGSHEEPEPHAATATHGDGPPILQAFMYGLQAGAQADHNGRRQPNC
jgi:hypothetical protein